MPCHRTGCQPRRKVSTHIFTSTTSLVDDEKEAVLAISLLEEGGDTALAATSKHFLLVKAVGEDEGTAGLEPRLEKVGDSLPCMVS